MSQVLQSKIIIVVLHHVLQERAVKLNGLVVQLVRIHACHAWGRGFESRPDRKKAQRNLGFFRFWRFLKRLCSSVG
jgi:putative component of membrane protein insertase Oxa1/YidC/SpoIIIJ protein YidD